MAYEGISPVVGVTRKVLVILWDPHYPNVTRPSRDQVEETMFGSGRSVKNYFAENSANRFGITSAGVHGWFEADHPLEWYDGIPNRDKCGAAIKAAAQQVDFQQFDINHDGVITPDELMIVFAHPGGGWCPGGLWRGGDGERAIRDPDTGDYLKIGGVRLIREAVELAIGTPANPCAFIHELLHMFNLGDMYFTFFTPTAAGPYSVMDQHCYSTHIDPFHKLKLGWLDFYEVTDYGWYTLHDVETRHEVLLLVDPDHGTDEYFIIENRWPGTSFDSNLPDRGVAVWHIMENIEDYSTAPTPPFTDPAQWQTIRNQWPRAGIRMIRPILNPPFDNLISRSLWDGSHPDTGYNLLSDDPNPNHPSLRWADGTPSGFSLEFTEAAQTVQIHVLSAPHSHEHEHQHPHEVGDHHHHPHEHPHAPGVNHHHPISGEEPSWPDGIPHEHAHEHPHVVEENHHHPHAHPHRPGKDHHHPY